MYFLSRTNRAYSWCAHRTPVQRYVLTLICISLCIWVWFVFIYTHTRERARAYAQQAVTLAQQVEQCARSRAACTTLNTSIASLDAAVVSYSNESTRDTQQCIAALVGYARTAKLTFKGCAVEHDGLMTVSCEGSLRSSVYFLHALKESSLLACCTRVNLQSASADAYSVMCTLKMR